jgi:hypothetical protein
MPCNVRDDRSKIGVTLALRPISKRKDDLDHKRLAGHRLVCSVRRRWVQLAYRWVVTVVEKRSFAASE